MEGAPVRALRRKPGTKGRERRSYPDPQREEHKSCGWNTITSMYSRRTLLAMPAFAGISPVKAASPIGARMQEMIDKREIPGAVTMVARRDGIAHLEATGHADPEAKKPLKKDAIFWIAS